ncbi:MAG: DNA-directed RNA polymerase subunit K [archaeon]|nr:DNA-directed RNA polymerase subunit K [archaeon]
MAKYSRFDRARIIGARAIQISCGAPIFVEYEKNLIDPIDIAMLEFEAGVIPISVLRE